MKATLAQNDLVFAMRVIDFLAGYGLRTWLFGGWAEELRGLAPPRAHRNVDLLYPAPDFRRFDELGSDLGLDELRDEDPCVRTFELEGIVIELLLVRRSAQGWLTDFPGGRYVWPGDVFERAAHPPVASAAAVEGYRAAFTSLHARAA